MFIASLIIFTTTFLIVELSHNSHKKKMALLEKEHKNFIKKLKGKYDS